MERWSQGDMDGYEQYQEQLDQDRAYEQACYEAQCAEAEAKAQADEEQARHMQNTHDLGVCLRFANGQTCIGCGDEVNGDELPAGARGERWGREMKRKRQMTEREALSDYETYCAVHVATKDDPLRTFSGWLSKFKVEIVDLSEAEAAGPS